MTIDWPVKIPVLRASVSAEPDKPGWQRESEYSRAAVDAASGFMDLKVFAHCAMLNSEEDEARWKDYRPSLSRARTDWIERMLRQLPLPILPPVLLLAPRDLQISDWFMTVGEDTRFLIASGHDRSQAMMNAASDLEHDRPPTKIPFTCLLNPTKDLEERLFLMSMRQPGRIDTDIGRASGDPAAFRESRSAAVPDKGMPTDHAARHGDTAFPDTDTSIRDQDIDLPEHLNRKDGSWRGMIKMPGIESTGDETITRAAFVRSLLPFFTGRKSRGARSNLELTKTLYHFWEGIFWIKQFDHAARNRDYLLQKALGASVMHMLLADILESDPPSNNSWFYADLLGEPLLGLSGERSDGQEVGGPDFWLAGRNGAATVFNSTAGRRHLATKLLRSLPPEFQSTTQSTEKGEEK